MSYPPGPQNPYGQQPPQQPQPPYGYPQQPQPPYGAYPQQQPQQPQAPYGYPGPQGVPGVPGAPGMMPSSPKGARVLLFVVGGLEILTALFMFFIAGAVAAVDDTGALHNYTGIGWFVGVFALALGAVCIAMATKFTNGGPGTRTGAIVLGSLIVVISLASFLLAGVLAIFTLVLGILVVVFSAKAETAAWFNRPRY